MILKKGEFLITKMDRTWVGFCRNHVKGYIDEENNVGYDHRSKYEWVATDIETGYKIASGDMLKDCQENVKEILKKLKETRNTESYKEIIKKVEEYPIKR